MKLYSVNLDIDDENPRQWCKTLKEARTIRSSCEAGYGAIERIETSPDMTPLDIVLGILNETGWVAKRVEVKPDKARQSNRARLEE